MSPPAPPPAPPVPVPAPLAPAAAQNGRVPVPDAPSFEALLHHLRQEVARVLDLPPESRPKEEPALLSLANRALARCAFPDKSAIPPPLLQIDAYQRAPRPTESLSKYLEARRAVLALDGDDPMDGGDKDAIGEPAHDSMDAGRDSDEDAIGSEHPRSPSLGPTTSPVVPQRHPEPRLPTPTPSSPRPTSGTAGNTTGELLALPPYQFRARTNNTLPKAVSSPESRSTVSAPPRAQQAADQKKPAAPPDSVDHTFTGDERCTNCIMRNHPTCVVNSSRQRCDSCLVKRHRCSKVLTPPSRPSRESNSSASTNNNTNATNNNKAASTSKGKATGGEHPRAATSARSLRALPSPAASTDAPIATNGESASARAQKRKRTIAETEDTKRPEPAKRPTRPSRPTTTTAPVASTSASASAPPARAPVPKREKPPVQNGVPAASSSASASAGPNALAALAASASRAPRAPVTAQAPAGSRQQQYHDKLQVIAGILEMVQNAVRDLQDQIRADGAVRR
ncbi:hypothetical protein BV20DRAFT_1080865 [Pilatotrama ljubarskyi]|nr:hypothetical protein BV20DRAFT_1080865 [Pilatotrama ljubarskyi]